MKFLSAAMALALAAPALGQTAAPAADPHATHKGMDHSKMDHGKMDCCKDAKMACCKDGKASCCEDGKGECCKGARKAAAPADHAGHDH